MPSEDRKRFIGTPEFRTLLKAAIESSRSRREAAQELGYKDPKTVTRYMKMMGIDAPSEWRNRAWITPARWKWLPEVVIPNVVERMWVAGLTQGETCIQSRYQKNVNTTYLTLDTSMADQGPILRFADLVGVRHPTKPVKNHDWKPIWRVDVSGLRALRVLKELYPHLLGEKKREAQKAIEFFSPFGNRRGCFRNVDIWPKTDFPWRKKGSAQGILSSGGD